MKGGIYKPIFIVGCGRSGTTLLYDLLAKHEDLSWISNFSNKLYPFLPVSAGVCALAKYKVFKKLTGREIKPLEGYRLWDFVFPVENSPNDHSLTENDVNCAAKKKIKKFVHDHIKYSGKKRFINKNTRNSRRIKFLNAIFPDSLFVHFIRDGRAVTASLINVPFWNKINPWFEIDNRESGLNHNSDNSIKTAARMWKTEVSKILKDMECLNKDRYLEIRYEELVSQPEKIFKLICDFCDLKWSDAFKNLIVNANLTDMNYRYKERLSEEQIAYISETLFDFAETLGYKF